MRNCVGAGPQNDCASNEQFFAARGNLLRKLRFPRLVYEPAVEPPAGASQYWNQKRGN